MRLTIKFMLAISSVLIVGAIVMMVWVYYSSHENTLRQAVQANVTLSEAIDEAVHEFMRTGKQEYLDTYLEKASKFQSVREVRVIRSAALEKVIGVKNGTRAQDDLDRRVLRHGQTISKEVIVGQERGIRCVSPIFADKSCLACHANIKEGEVIAALSVTVLFQSILEQMAQNLGKTGFIQGIIIFVVIGIIFVFFNTFIMKPVMQISNVVKRLGEGDWAAAINLRSRDKKKASSSNEEEATAGSLDEIGELADAFNKMSGDLRKITVSRAELFEETVERKKAEEQLLASEAKYRELFEESNDAILIADAKTMTLIDCNKKAEEMTGYSKQELLCMRLNQLCPEKMAIEIMEAFEKPTAGTQMAVETEILTRDRERVAISINSAVVKIQEQRCVMSVIRDFTERKRVEERLHRLNQLQTDMINADTLQEKYKRITDGVVNVFNADFARIWMIGPGDRCDSGCPHAAVSEGPHVCRVRDRCLHLVASSGRYTHTDGGVHARVPLGCYKIGGIASGEYPSFLTNGVLNDPRVHDHEWAKELGLVSFAGFQLRPSHGEVIGVLALFSRRIISAGEYAMLESVSSMAVRAVEAAQEEENLRKTNEALINSTKNLEQTLGKLKMMQRELIQSEKLASIGLLAAGIAHEINNPVSYINSNLSTFDNYLGKISQWVCALEAVHQAVLQNDPKGAGLAARQTVNLQETLDISYTLADTRNLLKESREGIERIKKIVSDLRSFARRGDTAEKDENLNLILDGVINLVWNEIKYNAELKKEYGEIPFIRCDSQELGQVFMNILINAVQALETKGLITVRTYSTGQKVCAEISDTGIGISRENIGKIFDPFFTTKPVGKGTGLGLSICYDIVKKHGGDITVKSDVGKGTAFTVSFPVDIAEAP